MFHYYNWFLGNGLQWYTADFTYHDADSGGLWWGLEFCFLTGTSGDSDDYAHILPCFKKCCCNIYFFTTGVRTV